MITTVEDFVAFLVHPDVEGGYVNDIHDPGGETKYGISKRAYPSLDIKSLTIADVTVIYRRDYWLATGCDKLTPRLRLITADCAVNQGANFARTNLQSSLKIKPDGSIGPVTLAAAAAVDAVSLAREVMARRALRYACEGDQKLGTYGLGWFRRLALVSSLTFA